MLKAKKKQVFFKHSSHCLVNLCSSVWSLTQRGRLCCSLRETVTVCSWIIYVLILETYSKEPFTQFLHHTASQRAGLVNQTHPLRRFHPSENLTDQSQSFRFPIRGGLYAMTHWGGTKSQQLTACVPDKWHESLVTDRQTSRDTMLLFHKLNSHRCCYVVLRTGLTWTLTANSTIKSFTCISTTQDLQYLLD